MRIPALVFARGGSRRIPRKNMVKICGKPIVEWSLIQAQCSRQVTDVFLITDDDEIADVGERRNAEVIRQLPTDFRRMGGTIATVLGIEHMVKRLGWFDTMVSIAGSGMLRMPDDIDRMITKRLETTALTVVIMCPIHEPWFFKKLPDGYAQTFYGSFTPEGNEPERDDEEMMFHFGGAAVSDPRTSLGTKKSNPQHLAWVAGKPWQFFDLDRPEYITIIEGLFRTQIIEPLGGDCYEKYHDGK